VKLCIRYGSVLPVLFAAWLAGGLLVFEPAVCSAACFASLAVFA
jgi:hypothetical protein